MDELHWVQLVVHISLGVGLAAASGFRVFVPPLVLGLALKAGLPLQVDAFAWLGTWPAILAFTVASVAEVGAYYIPWFDHALDALTTPLALIAGTLLTAGALTGMDPAVQWPIAVIAGGGAAAATQATTVLTRAASTMTTGGLGNSIVSTIEGLASTLLSLIALLIAPVAVILLFVVLYQLVRLLRRKRSDATT